jgi:hypothetical protein
VIAEHCITDYIFADDDDDDGCFACGIRGVKWLAEWSRIGFGIRIIGLVAMVGGDL